MLKYILIISGITFVAWIGGEIHDHIKVKKLKRKLELEKLKRKF